uniref:Uncharacterized protein n=1 Tax=Anguilla anguilla TaxID=7936 RepID=A0A0E9W599_ANGAN
MYYFLQSRFTHKKVSSPASSFAISKMETGVSLLERMNLSVFVMASEERIMGGG